MEFIEYQFEVILSKALSLVSTDQHISYRYMLAEHFEVFYRVWGTFLGRPKVHRRIMRCSP